MLRCILAGAIALTVTACSPSDSNPVPDTAQPPDAALLPTDAAPSDTSSDVGASGDAAADTDAGGGALPPLTEPPALPILPNLCEGQPAPTPTEWSMASTKVSVNVFHFNIQYVAGGLDNYLGVWTASEEEIEDLIIVESFEPLVALFERHPTWGASFEMQALMLEILAKRHPDILTRFQVLARRGQIDVMSYHWSDQLVTAYPRQVMDWSWEETDRVFEALCIPRAPVDFLQEGQFGPGIAQYAFEKAGHTVILPRNLLGYFFEDKPKGLQYDHMGTRVLVTDGFAGEGLELNWNWVDDAELVATGDVAPYLLSEFKYDPEYLKTTYEAKLQSLADQGFEIAPLSHYIAILDDRDVPRTPIVPPVTDGSWQPNGSANMHLWMGGTGQVPGDERDNAVLTGNIAAMQALENVQWLLEEAAQAGVDTGLADRVFRFAVRELLLATVSDATGWRPAITEVEYGLRHQAEAMARARELGAWLVLALGHPLPARVSGADQTITATGDAATGGGTVIEDPIGVGNLSDRPVELTWRQFDGYKELTAEVPATDSTTAGTKKPPVLKLTFPLTQDAIVYTPALLDNTIFSRPLAEAAAIKAGKAIGLALPNGLIGLGANQTLVLDQTRVHLAALITDGLVTFEDGTQPAQDGTTWVFRLYDEAPEAALPAANALNVHPATIFE